MFTLFDYSVIARILGTYNTKEAQEAWEALHDGFMVPEIARFEDSPDRDYLDKMGEDPDPLPGFYARLTAPGYLDATDWSGPFDTIHDAAAELISLHLA